jgi:hypothetical protein
MSLSPYTPIGDSATIGASGSATFDYTAQGTFATCLINNEGDGVICVAFGSIPANTTPGAGKFRIPSGKSLNFGNISLGQIIGVRADGSGATVDIVLQIEQTDGGGIQ